MRQRPALNRQGRRCHPDGMPFPNLAGKHAGRPYVTAQRLLRYHQAQGNARDGTAPRAVILTWQARLEARVRERRGHHELPGPGVGAALLQLAPDLGLARLPIGAPAAAIAVEELSARGAELFIGIGTAGGIGQRLAAGDLVVCSAALRDEGTSYHYAPPEAFAWPDPELTARLRTALPTAAHGPSWTTDAPYRETAEEVARYGAEGMLTVEMEASCLFTVAAITGTAAAAAFVVSDTLSGEQWQPRFGSAGVLAGLWALFEAAGSCLSSLPAQARDKQLDHAARVVARVAAASGA
jgi:uridine phosphorylase